MVLRGNAAIRTLGILLFQPTGDLFRRPLVRQAGAHGLIQLGIIQLAHERTLPSPPLALLLRSAGVVMLARAIATQFAADRRGSTPKSRGDFLLIGSLVTQLRYVITFLDCKLTAHRWDSVPKGEFARLHPLETPSDDFSNTSCTCLISQASIAIEIRDRHITGHGNTGPTDAIQQIVATTVGQNYILSFYVGRAQSNNGNSTYQGPATVDLSINGGGAVGFTNTDAPPPGFGDWANFSTTFIATGSTTTITFLNGTGGQTYYAGLDNVSMVEVPEPSTLVLSALGGVGLSVAAARRRRRHCKR